MGNIILRNKKELFDFLSKDGVSKELTEKIMLQSFGIIVTNEDISKEELLLKFKQMIEKYNYKDIEMPLFIE